MQVAPAKPDYIVERKAKEERKKMEDKLAREEEKKDKELKQKIKQTEEKLQRRRVPALSAVSSATYLCSLDFLVHRSFWSFSVLLGFVY